MFGKSKNSSYISSIRLRVKHKTNKQMKNLEKMSYESKVEIFTTNMNVSVIAKGLGLSEELTIKYFCGDDYTFNKWYSMLNK